MNWEAIVGTGVGLIMAVSAGVALLVRMKIDQSTMKVTVETYGKDITDLKTGQVKQDEKSNSILISLAKIETKLGVSDGTKTL